MSKKFNTNKEINKILIELNKFKAQVDDNTAKSYAEIQLEDIKDDTQLDEPSTPQQKAEALSNIIILCLEGLLSLNEHHVLSDKIDALKQRLQQGLG
jgi:hypothetical protein